MTAATLPKLKISRIKQREMVMPGKGFVDAYHAVINPYQGCSFGCSYCYASNFVQTPQEKRDWGQWVKVKANAQAMMNAKRPGSLNGKTVYMATTTDPYQPVERTEEITKLVLEDLIRNHPKVKLVVQTRAPMVTRDIPLFQEIAGQGGRVQVNVTITTDDDRIRKIYEPGCPSIPARLKAAKTLHDSGVAVCITITPALPIMDAARFAETLPETGAKSFIIQPFKSPDLRKGANIAITDRRAVESAMRWYQTDNGQEAMRRYNAEYRRDEEVLRRKLAEEAGLELGFGKAGFKPPF